MMSYRYRRILVAFDGSDEASAALARGTETALAHDSVLALCHVLDNQSFRELQTGVSDDLTEALAQQGDNVVLQGKAQAEEAGVRDVRIFIRRGIPKMTIPKEVAEQFQADLIIAGGSGAGTIEKKHLGRVAVGIVRRAPCDVWIIKNERRPAASYRSIFIAVDGSDASVNAFYAGLHLAHRHHSRVQVAYVLNTPALASMEPFASDMIRTYQKRAMMLLDRYRALNDTSGLSPGSVHFSVERGAPKTVIPLSAPKKYQAHLVILGASGIDRIPRFLLGSIAENTVRHARRDVLVIRNSHRP